MKWTLAEDGEVEKGMIAKGRNETGGLGSEERRRGREITGGGKGEAISNVFPSRHRTYQVVLVLDQGLSGT